MRLDRLWEEHGCEIKCFIGPQQHCTSLTLPCRRKSKLSTLNKKFDVPSVRRNILPREEQTAMILEVVELDQTGYRGVKSTMASLARKGISLPRCAWYFLGTHLTHAQRHCPGSAQAVCSRSIYAALTRGQVEAEGEDDLGLRRSERDASCRWLGKARCSSTNDGRCRHSSLRLYGPMQQQAAIHCCRPKRSAAGLYCSCPPGLHRACPR